MREILIYGISGCASLVVLAYAIHIFIGGLVNEETETIAIIAGILIGTLIMVGMAWDVLKTRRK